MPSPPTPSGSPPKVHHLIHADGEGGGPRLVIEHIRYFRNLYDTHVYHGGQAVLSETCDQLGIGHTRLAIDRPLKWPLGLWQLAFTLNRQRPDLLVLHGQWGAALGVLAAIPARIPRCVYLAHWPAFYGARDFGRELRGRLCEVLACRFSRQTVVLSPSNRYQYLLRNLVPEDRITVLPDPVDGSRIPPDQDRQAVRRQFQWDDSECHVVFVGRLARQKRVDWLLQSWKRVAASRPHARLWIVGDGEERACLTQQHADLELKSSCRFLGSQPHGIAFLGAADIAVMPSLFESPGLVPIEAMACGRPVVACRVDGIRDTVTDGSEGFLVQPGDVRALGDRLIELIDSPDLRRRMGEAGRRTAARYAPDRVFPAYRNLFDRLLADENPASKP